MARQAIGKGELWYVTRDRGGPEPTGVVKIDGGWPAVERYHSGPYADPDEAMAVVERRRSGRNRWGLFWLAVLGLALSAFIGSLG